MPEQTDNGRDELVYVIGTPGSKTAKIGRTIDTAKRLGDIQRMSPTPLSVLWTHPGGHELETYLHRQFSALRTHGEWFTFGGDPVDRVRWAVGCKPWLRSKVSLAKSRRSTEPKIFDQAPILGREELESRLTQAEASLEVATGFIAEIADPSQRYEAMRELEERVIKTFRAQYQSVALELKRSGRTWRQVGKAMGGLTSQRAHQISLGGAPAYGARRPSS